MMNDESNQPRKYDLVLGSNNPPPTDGLVLGGIDGLKLQFSNANSEDKKIAILQKALSYGEVGEAWLFDLIATEKNKIQWLAAVLLSNTKNQIYKELLLEYFAEFIPNNVDSWNEYKRSLSDLEINLSRINLSGAKLQEIDLSEVNLNEAKLITSDINKVNFNQASLIKANFFKSSIGESNFFETDLREANLEKLTFYYLSLKKTNLGKSNLTKTFFVRTEIDKVNLRNANFSYARLTNWDTIIQNISFDNSSLLEHTLFDDIEFINVSFIKIFFPNLSFSGSSFKNALFDNCDLSKTSFAYCRSEMDIFFRESNLANINGSTELKV